MKDIERALKKEVLLDLSELEKMGVGSEEHISGMKTVNEAIDRLTKLEEMRTKATIEEAKRLTEESIAQANLEETKRNDRRKVIVDSLSIGIPAVLSAWSFVTGLLYEERGIVKSNIVRKIFDKIITMRK